MSYVGDEDDAAPQLHRYRLSGPAEGEELLEQCIRAVERMLFHDVVHGDLSPFNVLVWRGQISVIDLPQAVDPKKNRHAESLLARDVARICEHFARRGSPGSRPDGGGSWTGWTSQISFRRAASTL